MNLAKFSSTGFEVTANNAVDYIAGTQAAGAGMISANIQETSSLLRADLGNINSTLVNQTDKIAHINTEGFANLGESMSQGFSTLNAISGASLAVQAGGFALVAKQLHGLRGDVNEMHEELAAQGQQLISLQRITNAHLGSLVDFAARTLETQEKILETLVTSKTVEAQQFIRQGWENLVNGYEDDAFQRFQRSLKHDNTVYVAHAALAQIYAERGQDEIAEDHYVRATRFSEKAGDEVQGFSLVNYANFLEQRGRYTEAVKQLDAALQLDDIDDITRGSWCLYHAELLARAGSPTPALSSVEESIDIDDSFFLASMASEKLRSVQPELSSTLIEIDEHRRTPIVEELHSVGETLNQLEVFDQQKAESLRSRAANLFEEALTNPYNELPSVADMVDNLRTEVDAALHQQLDQTVERIESAYSTAENYVPSPPKEVVPNKVLLTLDSLIAVVLAFILWVFAIILSASIHPVATIGSLFFLPPLLAVFLLFLISQNSDKDYKNQVTQKTPRWLNWRDERQRTRFSAVQIETIERKKINLANLDVDLKARLLEKINNLRLPDLPPVPDWMEEQGTENEATRLNIQLRTIQTKYLECLTRHMETKKNTDKPRNGMHSKAQLEMEKYREDAAEVFKELSKHPDHISEKFITDCRKIGLLDGSHTAPSQAHQEVVGSTATP